MLKAEIFQIFSNWWPSWKHGKKTTGNDGDGKQSQASRLLQRLQKFKLRWPLIKPNKFGREGLQRIRVIGDGRCLFRAVVKAMALQSATKLDEERERREADALRERTWNAVCFERREEFSEMHVIEGDYDTYIVKSRSTSFYGGYPEILAMADYLNRCVQVYMDDSNGGLRNILEIGSRYKKPARPGVECSDGIIRLFLSKKHFELLMPITS